MFISRKKMQEHRETLAVMTVMTETLINANDKALAYVMQALNADDIDSARFTAVDNAGFELKWASEYVKARLTEIGVTIDIEGNE